MNQRDDQPSIQAATAAAGSPPGSRKSGGSGRVVTDTVHNRLRDAILSAELRPNRRLVEDEIALWLNVSRTPVREALLRLEQEGLVERSHGWVVREYDPAEIRSRLECRLAVEGYAARLACARRTEGHLSELRGLALAMTEPGLTRYEFNALNDKFHRTITEAAGNPTLASLHAQTKLNYWDLSVPVIFSAEDDRIVADQHDALIGALLGRDANAAESLAREHVQRTLDVVLRELTMMPPPLQP
jgi:DNA-binding GntR family transcriptional regulator